MESEYTDAKEAIDYFREKRISLEEVTVIRPGEPAEIEIGYRNIAEANLQVYRVDLMRLYLREKNLSTITRVRLAGIRPELTLTVPLGDGKDYVDKEMKARLDLTEEAAYLVICRGDALFASGLVLIPPPEIEVQEDPSSGRVRVNVLDTSGWGLTSMEHWYGLPEALFDDRVVQARGGDFSAFEGLYHDHVGRIFALCVRMTADPRCFGSVIDPKAKVVSHCATWPKP